MTATIHVDLGERSYPVHIGEGLLGEAAIFAPHVAGWTEESMYRVVAAVCRQMLDVLRGQRPRNLTNPEVWPRFQDRSRRGVTARA